MTSTGINTIIVATGDADVTIVRCGLDRVIVHATVAIAREDVDLIVLLVGLAPPSSSNFICI